MKRRRSETPQTVIGPAPDFSFPVAARFTSGGHKKIRIVMVGCGGTGSHLAPAIAGIARVLKDKGRRVKVTFIDPDTVELKNIGRQNFCDAELGEYKAVTLADRCGQALGLEIAAVPEPFNGHKLIHDSDWLMVLVGCVDNPQARREIAGSVGLTYTGETRAIWLDCGNHEEAGQVLIGTDNRPENLKECFPVPAICHRLPSPALQRPTLLEEGGRVKPAAKLSCADLTALNQQSLVINRLVAAHAADYLVRLLVTHNLKKFATFFDFPSGTTTSSWITPEAIAHITKLPARDLVRKIQKKGEPSTKAA